MGNVDEKGHLKIERIDRTASTKDSVFARVRELPPEHVAVLGARGYKMKIDPSLYDPATGTFIGEARYKVLDLKLKPAAPVSCRRSFLKRLYESTR